MVQNKTGDIMLNKFGVIEQLRNPSIDYTKNEKMIAHYILENIEQ